MRISISVLLLAKKNNLLIDEQLAVICALTINQKQVQISAFIDSATFGYGFIDHSFAYR